MFTRLYRPFIRIHTYSFSTTTTIDKTNHTTSTTSIKPKQTTNGTSSFSYIPNISELPLNSIIKIYSTTSTTNYISPWQNKTLKDITGSGFIINNNLILTNAHVIADSKFIMIRKYGDSLRYRARVLSVGHECDLALLSVDDNTFFNETEHLEFGNLPYLEEEVSVIGYPTGGDNISVTRGVVSRVEPQQYAHGVTTLLAIQIDAAINPGNSGGPALQEGKVIGVAFQNLTNAENIGFIIPVPIIKHFLKDVEISKEKNLPYSGFCSLGVHCQGMENIRLREFKNMGKRTGVLITKVNSVAPCKDFLNVGDVILNIDGYNLANDGSIVFREKDRISFDYLIGLKHENETIPVTILRNGNEITVDVPLSTPKGLVPAYQYDAPPSYFICAGLVFIPLSQPYLHEWGEEWYNTSPRKLCDKAMYAEIKKPGEQSIVLSNVLSHAVTVGYNDLTNNVLKKVNSIPITNLAHLAKIVDGVKEGPIVFQFEDERLVVIDAKDAKEKSQEILDLHRVPKDRERVL